MSSTDGGSPRRVGLLTQDLLVRSRVEAALVIGPAKVETVAGDELDEEFDLLLVDLNRNWEQRLSWLGRTAATWPAVEVICFGPHTEMAQLSSRARAAGATSCVANSHLAQTLQRWQRSGQGAPARPRRATQ